MNATNDQMRDAVVARIAREHLQMETLGERHSDHLDFHELSVWSNRAALVATYEAGRASNTPRAWNTQPLPYLTCS